MQRKIEVNNLMVDMPKGQSHDIVKCFDRDRTKINLYCKQQMEQKLTAQWCIYFEKAIDSLISDTRTNRSKEKSNEHQYITIES